MKTIVCGLLLLLAAVCWCSFRLAALHRPRPSPRQIDEASRLTYSMSPPASSICQRAAIPRGSPPPQSGDGLGGRKPVRHKSGAQITDILSVYRCTVHPSVPAEIQFFSSALRVGEGGGAGEGGEEYGGGRSDRGDGHFSSFLWGSAIFHNLFCLVTPCSQTLEMHCGCCITE